MTNKKRTALLTSLILLILSLPIASFAATAEEYFKELKIVPYYGKDGGQIASKLFKVRRDSVWDEIGMRNGMIIKDINGLPLTNEMEAKEALMSIFSGDAITLTVLLEHPGINLNDVENESSQARRVNVWSLIRITTTEDDEGNPLGVRVSFVDRQSVFSKAGIRKGDILKVLSGRRTLDRESFEKAVNRMRSKRELTTTLLRDGEELDLRYTLPD